MKTDRVHRFATARRLAGHFAAAFLQCRSRARHPALLRTLAWRLH